MTEIQTELVNSVNRNNLIALSILIRDRRILPNTRKRQAAVYVSLI